MMATSNNVYVALKEKPPMSSLNKSAIGTAQQKFRIDGVAHINLSIKVDEKTLFINYEPVLISRDINKCIHAFSL